MKQILSMEIDIHNKSETWKKFYDEESQRIRDSLKCLVSKQENDIITNTPLKNSYNKRDFNDKSFNKYTTNIPEKFNEDSITIDSYKERIMDSLMKIRGKCNFIYAIFLFSTQLLFFLVHLKHESILKKQQETLISSTDVQLIKDATQYRNHRWTCYLQELMEYYSDQTLSQLSSSELLQSRLNSNKPSSLSLLDEEDKENVRLSMRNNKLLLLKSVDDYCNRKKSKAINLLEQEYLNQNNSRNLNFKEPKREEDKFELKRILERELKNADEIFKQLFIKFSKEHHLENDPSSEMLIEEILTHLNSNVQLIAQLYILKRLNPTI